MVNPEIRKAINEYATDHEIEIKILDDHAYDNSIVGITEDGRLVYDYDKMVEEFMNDENCQEIDAIEWIDYNTMRALPYFGEDAPIVIHSMTSITDLYL